MSTKTQLQWRRAKVLELSSQGYSQIEIANQLQVDEPTISRDVQYLRQQTQENLEKHIHEVVPEEYQKCMVGMKKNLKQVLETAESAADPKTKLQARAIANDCYRYIMELCTNAGIISDALKFVNQKQEQLNILQRKKQKLKRTQTESDEKRDIIERYQQQQEQKTNNGIFWFYLL